MSEQSSQRILQHFVEDLKTVQKEAVRRRLGPLSDAADRSINHLMGLQQKSPEGVSFTTIQPNDSAWYAFAMGAEALRSSKQHVCLCVGAIGRCADAKILPTSQVPVAAQMLKAVACNAKSHEDVLTRVVQALLSCISALEANTTEAAFIQEPLSALLAVHLFAEESLLPAVVSAAGAVLRQALTDAMTPILGVNEKITSESEKAISVFLVRDCCAMLASTVPKWLQLPDNGKAKTSVSPGLSSVATDALQTLFGSKDAQGCINLHPQLRQSINEELVPALISVPLSAPHVGRSHKLAVTVISGLGPKSFAPTTLLQLLSHHAAVIRFAESGNTSDPWLALGLVALWRKALGATGFISNLIDVEVSNAPAAVQSAADSTVGEAEFWTTTQVVHLLTAPLALFESAVTSKWHMNVVVSNITTGGPLFSPIRAVDSQSCCAWSPELASVLLDYITMLAQSFARWVEYVDSSDAHQVREEETLMPPVIDALETDQKLTRGVFRVVWPLIFRCAALTLELVPGDDALHMTLKGCAHLVHCACLLSDDSARDSILRLLLIQARRPSEGMTSQNSSIVAMNPSVAAEFQGLDSTPNSRGHLAQDDSTPSKEVQVSDQALRLRRQRFFVDATANLSVSIPANVTGILQPLPHGQLLHRSIHIVNCVVSIASLLGDALGGPGWQSVVEVFASLPVIFPDFVTIEAKLTAEVASLRSAVDHLFESSAVTLSVSSLKHLSECLLSVVTNLCQFVRFVGDGQMDDISPTHSTFTVTDQIALFSLRSLLRLFQAAISQVSDGPHATEMLERPIHSIWPCVREVTLLICQGGNPPFHFSASVVAFAISSPCEAFSMIAAAAAGPTIPLSAKSPVMSKQFSTVTTDSTTSDADSRHQHISVLLAGPIQLSAELFRRADSLFSSNHAVAPVEAKGILIRDLYKAVQRHGALITGQNWQSVLRVAEMTTDGSNEDVSQGFRLLEHVHHHYITHLGAECISPFIYCVGCFIRQHGAEDRLSVNLSAVQLAWSLADYLISSHREQGDESSFGTHCNSLLVQLREGGNDTRAEVQQSSLKTLFSLVITHGASLPPVCWPTVLWDILVPIFDSAAATLIDAPNQSTKQIDEIRQATLESGARIVRMFHSSINKHVPDARKGIKSLLTACIKIIQACGSSSKAFSKSNNDGVLLATTKCIGGILGDLIDKPSLLMIRDIDSCFMAYEQLGQFAQQSSTVSLNILKAVIDAVTEAMKNVQQRSDSSWTDSMCISYAHRCLAIFESSLQSAAVSSAYMFPCIVHSATFSALNSLLRECGLSQDAGLWRSANELVLAQIPRRLTLCQPEPSDPIGVDEARKMLQQGAAKRNAKTIFSPMTTWSKHQHPRFLIALIDAWRNLIRDGPTCVRCEVAPRVVEAFGTLALVSFSEKSESKFEEATSLARACVQFIAELLDQLSKPVFPDIISAFCSVLREMCDFALYYKQDDPSAKRLIEIAMTFAAEGNDTVQFCKPLMSLSAADGSGHCPNLAATATEALIAFSRFAGDEILLTRTAHVAARYVDNPDDFSLAAALKSFDLLEKQPMSFQKSVAPKLLQLVTVENLELRQRLQSLLFRVLDQPDDKRKET